MSESLPNPLRRALWPLGLAYGAAVALRHRRTWPKEITSLTRSYRRAVRSNIAATSCGCLSKEARVMPRCQKPA